MAKKTDASATEGKRIVSKYNPDALREFIQIGMNAEQVMSKLGLRNKQTLRKHLLRLMTDDKAFYEIEGLAERSVNPQVNAQGILRLNLGGLIVGDHEVNQGDAFSLSVEDGRIILTKVETS